jgi:hypothetical protein
MVVITWIRNAANASTSLGLDRVADYIDYE